MTLVAERRESGMEAAVEKKPSENRVSPCVAPALLTGGLLWACHFPLAWGWLSWIALVPLLTLTRANASSKRIYWSAYLAGLAFFVPALQWMRVADYRMYATWIMLATYCAVYFPLGLWLIRLLDRRGVPMILNVAMVWVGLEWVRSFALTGFAWYYLGHAQHRLTSLIQIADFGGVYAISFLVAAVNGWLCDLAFHVPALRDRFHWRETNVVTHAGELRPRSTWLWPQGFVLAAALVGAIIYGVSRIEEADFLPGPRVALLQTNVPQSVRNSPEIGEQMVLQNTALPFMACLSRPLVDLIVWPETSYLGTFVDIAADLPIEKVDRNVIETDADLRRTFREKLVVAYPAHHLLGINTYRLDAANRPIRHSSALLVHNNGSPTHRYDKIHRVPFGEYVPLRDWLPFMNALAPYETDYSISPGTVMTRFPVGDFHFGALVCYEDSDPILTRRFSQTNADGKPVDFLVNQSNDGWFRGTSEHEEHLVVSSFRAIENRRALVRAVNMGISAVIDPNGRVLKPQKTTPFEPDPHHPSANPKMARAEKSWESIGLWQGIKRWEKARPDEAITVWEVLPNDRGQVDELPVRDYSEFKGCSGVVIATVPIDRRTSIYSQWGDWLPIACWVIVVSVVTVSFLLSFFSGPLGRQRSIAGNS